LSETKTRGQVRQIADVLALTDYDKVSEHGNDIALVRLAEPLRFDDRVQPIEYATEHDARRFAPGVTATATGFRATGYGGRVREQLLAVALPIVPLAVASAADSGRTLSPDLIAAGGVAGLDTCNGDSGGPLVVNGRRKPLLVGLVSFGIQGCG